jgi:hypothetical protein
MLLPLYPSPSPPNTYKLHPAIHIIPDSKSHIQYAIMWCMWSLPFKYVRLSTDVCKCFNTCLLSRVSICPIIIFYTWEMLHSPRVQTNVHFNLRVRVVVGVVNVGGECIISWPNASRKHLWVGLVRVLAMDFVRTRPRVVLLFVLIRAI